MTQADDTDRLEPMIHEDALPGGEDASYMSGQVLHPTGGVIVNG